MKTSNRKIIARVSALLAAMMLTHLALAGPQDSSGIIVHAWYPGYCDPPEPGVGPWCTLPRPYYGTFSIFTESGRHVASASTAEDITATFTLYLRPGRYIVVPDDPALTDNAATVTVRARQLTDVLIWITEY